MLQLSTISSMLILTTACNISVPTELPVEEPVETPIENPVEAPVETPTPEPTPEPTPDPTPEPEPTPVPELTVLGPISISLGSDDGYSWGKYGSADWESDNIDNDFIRLGGAGNQDRDYISSLMFRELNIIPGQNILSAKIVFTAHEFEVSDDATIDLTIKAINPSSQTTFAVGDLGQDRALLTTEVQWNKSANNWETPDLSALIQAIVSDPNWANNQTMGFVISNTTGAIGNNRHNVFSANSNDINNQPKLFITYGDDNTAPTIINASPETSLSIGSSITELTLETNKDASCKFSEYPNTPYAEMEYSFMAVSSTTVSALATQHQVSFNNLIEGNEYAIYVRCENQFGTVAEEDFVFNFTISGVI